MSIEEALLAAKRRDLVRVSDERIEGLDSNHPQSGKTGRINELLGARFYTRGEPRAIIELDCDPVGHFIVVSLKYLEVYTHG